MRPTGTKEWVRAAAAGEEAAWNSLYKHYYPAAYAIALRICGHSPAAHDAVQDAFIIAYLKLSQLKDPLAFGGWLRKIVTHRCYRSLNYNRHIENISSLPAEADHWWEDQINMKFEQTVAQNRLHAALAQLPEVLSSTLFLRYFSSHQSYEEIAAILSVPIGTIRSRLNQAKTKLAEYWNANEDIDEKIFGENEQWNSFYYSLYSGMHAHDTDKNKFVDHLDKNVRIIMAGDKMHTGRQLFENIVADDRRAGSRLEPTQVLSCGNITVIETRHINSQEHPHHCPSSSVTVLYRNKGKANQMNLYIAP